MPILTPAAAAANLAHHIACSPGLMAGSLLAESLRERFPGNRFTDLDQHGTAFHLADGSELRIWPDVIVLADVSGLHESCWRKSDMEDEEVILAILSRT